MADRHDETARELLQALEWYAPRRRLQGIYDPKYSNDVRGVASALRKAEADGLREAARDCEAQAHHHANSVDDDHNDYGSRARAVRKQAARLRALAAEKETHG